MSDYAIITAGGSGRRMGGGVPKQFRLIGGRPVLMRTIERFREYSAALKIILVLPASQTDYWNELCARYDFTDMLTVVTGGGTRYESIRHGMAAIADDENGVVGIHDGVRPFPDVSVISKCYETARVTGAAIPVTPVVETLRSVTEDRNVNRDDFRCVQTPQCFNIQLYKKACRQPDSGTFTDDASVVEAMGTKVTMIDGNRENIKLTTPFDMLVAEALLKAD